VEAAVVIRTNRSRSCASQAGVALPIALIMLTAMILAAIALFRSVDTATMVAGNLTYKQRTVHAADEGVRAAYFWLQNKAINAPADLNNTNTGAGYYSSQHANDPSWNPVTNWPGAGTVTVATDAGGNTASYVIHRLCTQPGLAHNEGSNQCATSTSSSNAGAGGSLASDAPAFIGITYLYFRVTTKVVGPRNSTSYIQTLMLIPVT
jgi:Tfp pilus assembly protein PilX